MATEFVNVPGVHFRERRAREVRSLPTGVPVFIGLLELDADMPVGTPVGADSYGPIPLHHKSEFLGGASAYLGDAVDGFFDNGGTYCYVVAVKASDKPDVRAATAARMIDALNLTLALDDVDLIAVPDAHALRDEHDTVDESLVLEVQRAMIQHCATTRTRVAVLDALLDKAAQPLIDEQVNKLGMSTDELANAALYHPWVRTVDSEPRFVPPSGHVAGLIARTDAQAGVFKAPANAEVRGALDLNLHLSTGSVSLLAASGVNCIWAFPSRGLRVWGARTLSSNSDWTYLNVRRLVLTVQRWIDLNMVWAAFEPNVPALWARIERELATYLTGLWRAGALQGESVGEAFFVRCDAELNAYAVREVGKVVTEIGLAPSVPAQFIVVSVQHRSGAAELT